MDLLRLRPFRNYSAALSNSFERIDTLHDRVEPALHAHVVRADAWFQQGTNRLEKTAVSRFRLTLTGDARIAPDKNEFGLNPDFSADIELPNLESRWKLFLRSRAQDAFPDTAEEDIRRVTRLGISRLARSLGVEASVGVRLRIPPEAFAQIAWEPLWRRAAWGFGPGFKTGYETGDGLGAVASFSAQRVFQEGAWLDFFQCISGVRRTQRTDGNEFEQYFRVGRVWEPLEPQEDRMQVASDRSMAHGWSLRAGLSGHSQGETTVDGYLISATYRRPVYKKWTYLQIGPDVQWERDNNFQAAYRLRVGLDMLFWGTPER